MSGDLSGFSMMELFRSEAEGQVAILSEGLLALEGADASPATLESMMRAAHSLKGAARIVGVDAAVRVAHAMEDRFVAAQRGTLRILPAHVDTLLRAVDLLTKISEIAEDQLAAWHEANEAEVAAMVADLNAILEARPVPPAPPPAAPLEVPASVEPATPAGAVPVADPTAAAGAEVAPASPTPPAVAARIAAESAAPAAAANRSETADRVVKVAAENLSRLVGLAGESLVQSRQVRPYVDALQGLRDRQSSLIEMLRAVEERVAPSPSLAVVRDQIAQARAKADECSRSLLETLEEIEDFARRSEDLSGRLHHEVISSRMRPLADGIRGFPRMVRDLSRQLGKQAELTVLGEETGVDRDILEKLEAPLNHLIRNALDHAIEGPEERLAAGKAATGTIRLEAHHRAGMLQVTLRDDGRGIDPERLRARVVERGLAGAAMAGQLTEAELLEFLFLPGFSTKDAVTEISGRGVGLDVVQNMVRAVGGVVRVASQVGKGTRFTLLLPITRSVIRALLVRIAGEPYAFPLNRIDRILIVSKADLEVLEGRRHFLMDDQPIGLVEAAQVLELPPDPAAGAGTGAGAHESLAVVVASDRSHRFGMIVDAFLGERDLEVRPLDPRLGKVPDLSSASVLEDGFPVLIIDVEDMVRSIDNLLGGRRLKGMGEPEETAGRRGPRRILVVDDSITVRELERQMLEGRGYAVDIAVDGLDGWNAVRGGRYDLVISDVDMPRMDGIALVKAIKDDPLLRAIPVVIVSYKEREEDRLRGLDAGADAYLTKSSFHDQTLLETIADLLGEAGG